MIFIYISFFLFNNQNNATKIKYWSLYKAMGNLTLTLYQNSNYTVVIHMFILAYAL